VAITVYTDGACQGNPGPGGWAWAVVGGRFGAGPAEHTTNQRMEIEAVLEALRALADDPGPIEVVSDSTYVVNCFRDRWWEGWLAKGWVNSAKKPVANRDLWEPLIELVRQRGDVSFRWVKGHSGDVMNDLVDRLAVQAASTQRTRAGGGVADDLGPPDDAGAGRPVAGTPGVGGAAAAAAAATGGAATGAGTGGPHPDPWEEGGAYLAGRSLVVLGHRADQLGVPASAGEDHPVLEALRDHLGDLLAERSVDHPDLVVVSGLRTGAEMVAAEVAVEAGLPLVVVLPYPDPAAGWAPPVRSRFDVLSAAARDVVVLQPEPPDGGGARTASLRRRDAWFARWCDEAVVVWDGADEALGRLVRSLADRLGDDVTVVDPAELVLPHDPG
jgi:ribonuclease HI